MIALRRLALACLTCAWFAALSPTGWRPAVAAEPADLSGTWTWTWNDPTGTLHRHVLEVEGVGPDLAARERFDDEEPVKASEVKFDGKNVRLTVVRGDRESQYRGVLADPNTINGTVTVKQREEKNDYPWKATRRVQPK
jgi:hypothetical protein